MRRVFLAVVMILSFELAVNAQTFRGTINGTVTDPSGGYVPNAQVKATEVATGIDHNTVTTSEGQFAFQDIPLGSYKVTVTAQGFPPYTVDKVEVTAGTIYTLQIALKLASATTSVEVSAAALTLDTTTQTQTMSLSEDIVQNIPLNGRDFTQMIAVEPGFGGYNVGGFGSLNGTRPNQINWQINGVDNNDFWHNIPAINQGGVSGIAGTVLPIDAAEEFSVQTSSGPEGGRNAGGSANVVLKSGTNDIHGSVYYYNRNEVFGEPSPFFVPAPGTKAPRERNENYGFSAGGPIIKNKTFAFLSYEKNDFVFGLSGIATEPSDAWVALATDLLNNPAGKYGAYGAVAPSAASANAIGSSGFWPRSGSSSIAGLPASVGNFFSPSTEFGYSYNGVARVDHQITDKHHLSLHAIIGQGNQTAPLGGSPALGTASSNLAYYFEVAPLHDGNYGAVLNSTISSRFTNQFLFGASYFNQLFHDNNNSFDTKAMGIFLSPDATAHGQPIHGAPNIVIAPPSKGGSGGFEQIGLTPPEGRSDLTLHFTDILSYSVGKHQFRYGAEIRHGKLNEFYHRRGTGKFVFDGSSGPWAAGCAGATATSGPAGCQALITSNQLTLAEALADFLAGDVSSCSDALHVNNNFTCGSTIAVGDPERWVHVNAFNAYIQDSWQITKKLNLSYGLRYEYFGPMQSDKKDIPNFVPGTGFVVQDGSHPLFDPGKDHFAPRLGFAYQPTARGDLVVRGGFGVFYDQINLNPFLDFRPPVAAPAGIFGNPFGATPVSTYSRSGYNWDAVQAGNNSIFPGVIKCDDPLCTTASTNAGPVTPVPKFNLYSVSKDFRVPYFYNYNLQVEKSLGNTAIFQIGYVGSQGRKLNIVSNINQGGAFPTFGNILQLNTIGTSNYNALQTIFRTRGWRGLSTQFAYTWSHALDEVSEYRGQVLDDAFNLKADYGNSDYDTRHLFTVSGTYDVPKAPWATSGLTKRVFNDWQVSTVMNWHRGQPSDETLSGLSLIGNPYASVSHKFDPSFGEQWWNPAAFCSPGGTACPGAANLSRNKFTGPGFGDVDLSFIKNVPITERITIQLRADFFNLLNRINLASGVGSVGGVCAPAAGTGICTTASGFGQVTDTIGDFNGAPAIGPGEARNIQLAAKIKF